jgi:hypothetical protein
MTDTERWREPVTSLPDNDQWEAKLAEGWSIVAIEWERGRREVEPSGSTRRPIPYGLRISADCRHLEVDPSEKEVLKLMAALIAADQPLSAIARALNARGSRSREGTPWTQVLLFRLLPRLIEFGPEILSESEWPEQKQRILAASG